MPIELRLSDGSILTVKSDTVVSPFVINFRQHDTDSRLWKCTWVCTMCAQTRQPKTASQASVASLAPARPWDRVECCHSVATPPIVFTQETTKAPL